jgi:hypoxanthine-guanine phosphoribosyltransferase
MGAKFVLVDEVRQRVYALSDQIKAKAYAGQKVRVIGTLKGSGIEVAAMTLIKQKPH